MKRILKTRLPLITYNPTQVFDRNYLSACAQAGALPVFDTAFMDDDVILDCLGRLESDDFPFGIRLDVGRARVIRELENRFIPNLDLVVFSYEKPEQLDHFSFANRHVSLFIETLHIDLNDKLERISPNGLIIKGNEAPGKVSPYTSFILMQWYLANCDFPIFVHGGVGRYTAAGMFAAGASGIVLDNQLYLCDEAPLSAVFKKLMADVTETDTALLGETLGVQYRFFAKLGTKIVKSLKEKESALTDNPDADTLLKQDIAASLCAMDKDEVKPLQSLFFLGQDAAFASWFTRSSTRLADVITLLFDSIRLQIDAVDSHDPLVEDSPLALEHGTRYPVIQGPMANISDNPAFAKAVYDNGGLPFFAMGNLPANLADAMLKKGKHEVPRFGAGLIGVEAFNKTIDQHLSMIKDYEVPFALFAGGIPSQVNNLEKSGIKTYLHTPNMMMLDNAIESGCKRFIFEGTEAGGHVGSLSSCVLWECAMNRLMAQSDEALSRQTVIFAGGISSVYGSCFMSGLSSILAKRLAKVGIQVGSAYLFSKEIVNLKSIGTLYQNTLTQAKKTIVTGNTVGLPSRTVPTPFAKKLVEKEHARIKQGMSLSERKNVFEDDNLGSLLIGAKGFLPDIHGTNNGKPIHYDEKEQYERGNFLVGDSLAFLKPGMTISEIHHCYFHDKHVLTTNLNRLEILSSPEGRINDHVAVIGMGCVLPGAGNPEAMWGNILGGIYSIADMPEDRMDPTLYHDTDRQAEDKSYTKIAGLITDFTFDHERYGYTKEAAAKLSRSQQILIEAAYQAARDAGYLDDGDRFIHDKAGKTAVIVASCLGSERSNDLQLKYFYPELKYHLDTIEEYTALPPDQKETLLNTLKTQMSYGNPSDDPSEGYTLNMEASRIAGHFNTDGITFVVDAACATSFSALDCAKHELLTGRHDTVIMAGLNTNLSPEAFIGFGKMGALSALGSYPFDQRADGFVLGEGVTVFVLKRLKDAVRENDTVHGVIRSIGGSSDGKGKAIAAPNPEGQKLALKRCFENLKGNITVSDIDYIEAHGTSTIMGDQAEMATLKEVYQCQTPIGISSIKSQIGHLLGGAGAAGLLKALLSIRHQTLPPNGQFKTVSDNIDLKDSPLYIITEPKPWTVTPGKTRKAAVSSYGFGGINYHVVVEEFSASQPLPSREVFARMDEDANDNRIVFAGLGVVLPGAVSSTDFSKRLPTDTIQAQPMPEERLHTDYYLNEPDPVFRLPAIRAGVVDNFKFNNIKYKIPPMTAKSVDRAQLFALDAANQALSQSGLDKLLSHGNKTAVVLGTMPGRLHAEDIVRVRAPYVARLIANHHAIDKQARKVISEKILESIRARFPKNTEDTVPGFLSNIVSGRIANFFGCNGANFIVDAGDASSAVAMDMAALGLQSKTYDFALTGGVDANLYPLTMFSYKSMGILPETGNGPVMSEGAAIVVMTRLSIARGNAMPILGEYLGASFTRSPAHDKNAPAEDVGASLASANAHAQALSPLQVERHDSLAPAYGMLRAATSAVDVAANLIRKDETLPSYAASSIQTDGNLHGHLITGSLPPRLSGKKQVPSRKKEIARENGKRVVALLSGQGAQHPGMMKELYETYPDIKAVMDRGEALFKTQRQQSLLDMMFTGGEALNLTENTQPAVFLSTAAIYDYLRKRGFAPDVFIGHSVGEFSALFCAGLLDFDQAMTLILTRSSLMKEAADAVPGKIMVVFDAAGPTQDLIRQSGREVYPANKNSLKQTAVSGKAEEIEAFRTFLADKGVMNTVLTLSGAFHTPLFKTAADKLGQYLKTLPLDTAEATKIIANVNARPYPDDAEAIRQLLVSQITSPVEFITSVQRAYQGKDTHYIEIGPTQLLTNLLKNMDLGPLSTLASVNAKKGQADTFTAFLNTMKGLGLILEPAGSPAKPVGTRRNDLTLTKDLSMTFTPDGDGDFTSFIRSNESQLKNLLYDEYVKHKSQQSIDAVEKFDFDPGKVVVSGVAVGLPGKTKPVFDPLNFDKLLSGTNFIEPLSENDKELMLDKRVTKIQKAPDGNARFVEITNTNEVIQLAGQLGYFDLHQEYAIKIQYDTTIGLAFAAGIEALKDANIPLVMQHKKTSTGSLIPQGYALPEEMQQGTGVILSALWPYSESLMNEMTRYFYSKFFVEPFDELKSIYYHIMEHAKDDTVKEQATNWFMTVKKNKEKAGEYKMNRDFAHNMTPLGSAHFAQYIKAKGPNIQMSGACASTTQAIGIAEDWIRSGRCDRVIVVGGETPTSHAQNQWIGSGFLSLGAATTKRTVAEAAKPFDAKRNGTILGSGAVSMIIEKEEPVRKRGMRGQAEILGTHIGNTAHHVYNIDVKGISREMKHFVEKIEKRHDLDKNEYSKKMVFMSHETYTPARGGSADAEITALRTTYPDNYKDILISNTKGYTGHTLGAALEDAVLVKVMQKGMAPPIANLQDISDDFKDLRLSREVTHGDFEYGFHIAAGFGSHLAFAFFKRIEENTVDNNPAYQAWLRSVTGSSSPKLKIENNTLMADADGDQLAPEPLPTVEPAKPVVQPVNVREVPKAVAAPEPEPVAQPVNQVPAPSAPALQPAPSLLSLIRSIIAEQTGYTDDMLEEGLDLEADLGIDTVKQVEIFGKIAARFDMKVPENLKLKDLNTIEKLVAYMEREVNPALIAQAKPSAPTHPAPAVESAAPVAPAPAQGLTAQIKSVIAGQTGYDMDMLDDDLDLEADLGIDTVKQVEIFGKISAQYNLKVPENLKLKDLNTISKLVSYMEREVDPALIQAPAAPAPMATPVPAPAAVQAVAPASSLTVEIKQVIAEQTGYEMDMLDDDLDLEADLGIDTVKQVEIFGRISGQYNLKVPENLKLKDLNTIAKLVAYMKDKVDPALITAATPEPVPVPVQAAVPVATVTAPASSLASEIKQAISDQTGYEVDMLDDDLDLEADLGIDTVKQVEIFGKISAQYNLKVPENLKLKDLNTIARLVAYMSDKVDPALFTPAAAPEPAQAAAPTPALSAPASALAAEIKQVISDQTGYEADMLEDNLDLEADLGIDTVKQVEIFGRISASYNLKVPENLKLKDLNTIAKLVRYMDSQLGTTAPAAPVVTPPVQAQPERQNTALSGVKRFTVSVKEAESIKPTENPFENKTFLITRDSAGFADEICRLIQSKGGKTFTLGKSGADKRVDLSDPAATVNALKASGVMASIRGLIHLAPIDDYLNSQKSFDLFSKKAGHDDVVATALTSFFALIKELKDQLDQPGGLIAALCFNSVIFPYDKDVKGSIHPAFAGMAGLLKTVNKEYENTRVRIIDMAEDKPKTWVTDIAARFVNELCTADTRVEKGFRNNTPYVLTMAETKAQQTAPVLKKGDTVLVTGGALGITYEILKRTVETHGVNLVIMGRSPIKDLDAVYLAPTADAAFIMSRVKSRMKGAKPLDIKKAVDRIIRTREAVLNIKQLEQLGVSIAYESADVTDKASVERVIKKYPDITGAIHAAGIEESQFIEKKDLASFTRVTDVKIKGLYNIIKALNGRSYRFLITFSSVTARFGNEGQADYTAANDMIGKMLMKEKLRHPDRFYKVYAWTAWSGAGMAENDTIKKVLEMRGITFLPLHEGIDFFLADLSNTSDIEVVITGEDRDADADGLLAAPQVSAMTRTFPFLDLATEKSGNHARYLRTLDLTRDPFLYDHSMEDTPIFLGATGIETMAEAASELNHNGSKVVEVKDFSIPYGIKILKGRPKEIIIESKADENKTYACQISSVFTNPKGMVMGDPKLHYQGRFTLDADYAPPETVTIPEFTPVSYTGDAESLIYHPKRLFMEDLFKTLTDVVSFDGDLLITTFCDDWDKDFFTGVKKPPFRTDVVAIDAMFQTGGLLEFFSSNALVLPYKIERLTVHSRVEKGKTYYCLTRKTEDGDDTNTYQLELVDADGNLCIRIQNFQMVKLGMLEEPYRITDRIRVVETA